MKIKAFLIRCTVALLIATGATPLLAQSLEPFNPYSSVSPSAETYSMTKYGGLTPSLYSGAMTYSVPVFTYSDPDFTVPISLEYSFDGFRPSQHSGTVGYGWRLECGGAITREVRGLPDDDAYYGPADRPQNGYWWSVQRGFSSASEIFDSTAYWNTFCNSMYSGQVTPEMSRKINPFSHIPTQVSTRVVDGLYEYVGGANYDMVPDIYHFSFLGHHGDFMLTPDGTFRVFNSDLPSGEVLVEFSHPDEVRQTGTINAPTFVITLGDGTRYTFGGSVAGTEYNGSYNTASQSQFSHSGSATAFRLVRIDAPNGRYIKFNYSSAKQVSHRSDVYYSLAYSNGYNQASQQYRQYNSVYFSILESISVGTRNVVSFSYSPKLSDENAAAWFDSSTPEPSLRPGGITKAPYSLMLTGITVTNMSNETVEHAVLEQSFAQSGTPKMFLSAVSTLRGGKHRFAYNGSGIDFPHNDTRSTDHWGWWNGRQPQDIRDIVTFSGSRYDQVSGTSKDPDPSCSSAGALTRITYPTGGFTTVEYEGNSAAQCLDEEGVVYTPVSGSFAVGGVRVRKLSDNGGGAAPARETTYTYSDGFLFHMPRYCMVVPVTYVSPSGYGGSNLACTITGYNADSDYSVCRDGIIGYGTVTATGPDGSYSETVFSSYSGSTADIYQEGGMFEQITKRGIISYGDKIDCGPETLGGAYIAMPVSDRKNMRGVPLSSSIYHADGSLRKRTEYTYVADTVGLNWIFYNSLESFVRTPWECRSPLLATETVKDYTSDGTCRTTVRSLERNACGQVMKETLSSPDCPGEVTRLYRKYFHESGEAGASSALKGAVHSTARTRTSGGTEYLTGGEKYAYGSPSVHVKPLSATYYAFDTPVTITPSLPALTAITQGTPTLTSFQYDASTYYLTRTDRPGGGWTTYVWDGTHLASRTDNASGNTTTYTWKDLVGLAGVTYPSGLSETYEYDQNNRLCRILDADGNPVTKYQYNLAGTPTAIPGLSALNSSILRTTYTSPGSSSSHDDVTYYNGLGYPDQAIAIGASPAGNSVVTPIVYDNMWRDDVTSYLPFTVSSASGEYNTVWSTFQELFHYGLSGDTRAFSVKEYETSPLGRPLSWQRESSAWNAGGGHKVTTSYRGYSSSGDGIMKFSYHPGVSPQAVFSPSDQYSDGDLTVTTTTDEEGDAVSVFTDPWGREVCTRSFDGTVRSDTYKVYDQRDSLVLVIQPEGAATLEGRSDRTVTLSDNASNANNDVFREYCFHWRYDGWGDLVEMHTPGCGLEEYAYDARGRLVLMTNSLMSPAGTTIYRLRQTVYDPQDRITMERYVGSTSSLPALRSAARASNTSSLPSSVTGGFTHLCFSVIRSYFPMESFTYPASGPLAFVADPDVVATADVNKTRVKGMLKSETVYPAAKSDGTAPSSSASTLQRGYHYDSRGRVIQLIESYSDNHSRRLSTKYSFTGDVLATKETLSGPESTYITTTYTRDSRGRILSVGRDVGGNLMEPVTYGYDELGRLVSKSVGDSDDPMLETAFGYDIHDWTTSINAAIGNTSVFSETLRYASAVKDQSAVRFDGNISEITAVHGTLSNDTYAYHYDGKKRLLGADRYIGSSSSGSLTLTEGSMVYDRNGNITALKRYGDTGLDNDLSFTLTGNRMTGLSDAGTPGGSFTYSYDAMGNMTSDGRQGLLFSYNILNLPCGVTSATSGSLTYTYLADGTKVSAVKSDGSGKRYVGSMVYSVPASGGGSETLESAAWDEGRIGFTKSGSTYTLTDLWFVKDHPGNVRSVVDISSSLASPQVVERNDYLPFGTRMSAGTATLATNRYRLGGKEEQTFGSLDLGKVDFGARQYDPFIARWTTIDPMAAKYVSMSPYSYCAGNPVNLIDLDGQSYSDFDENGNYLQTINDTWWHNLWHGRTGRIVDSDGNIISSFRFADPKNDVADLKNGTITKIQFVQEKEIISMLSKAGAFNEENKVENTESRYGYIKKESPNNGKLDFALTGIPNNYSDYDQSLFLVDGVAHNRFNFGNYLWGAAGKALGLTSLELRAGAHYRALTQNGEDGYHNQFDSRDDQFSIKMGVRHANRHSYKSMSYSVVAGPLTINGF
ncbi:MAG: hypothetical protein IJK75_07740 [Bacteroidales bacterium]|nr:hypothetical protein [Bacteroidales bacterium]